ncbi:apolipophorins isoform X1 [Hippocampus comes]|uniref:apolipophorins isoform X1 n=1 Tax=Hippocampus comes TaxID=109280 RepID=UPI00094EC510|nr:PREDICTED: apolipophorins-like isoform X1 [Hippocampus comes]
MAMPWFYCLHFAFICLLRVTDCLQSKSDICDSSCAAFSTSDMSYQKGVRYTYRYKTTITTSLHGSNAGRNGLALDCLVDIDAISECHLMMQIRNPQIKRLSPQKDHPVPRLKSLRESLERTPLKFCLHGGKVFNLCIQEGEQMWTLNIKKAFLSMLQTSNTKSKHSEMETDVHGTCASLYERRGRLLLKTRSLKECHQSRLARFWTHSVALTGDTSVQSELRCIQAYGSAVMEEANCTETVSIATWSKTAGQVKTQTESTLQLLRAQSGTVAGAESLGCGTKADLRFEDEGAARPGNSFTPHQVIQTTRMVCSVTSHPQEVSHWFLELTFQLRELTLPQLKTLWREASFKCRNDWQPLLDALPACGSENCVILLTDLMKKKEVEDEQAHSFLTTIALIPNPSPQIIHSLNTLVNIQEVRDKALLAGSSLIHQLCQRSTTPCVDLSQVQAFIQKLEVSLKECREPQSPAKVREFIYAMKSVGNMGLAASIFIPLLNHCGLNQSAPLELRLAAIKAFRRFDCTTNRTLLLQLYRSSLEDPEVRIAAYQELMRCPDQDVFEAVKVILRNENSSQVGSFVWSHLTSILRSEDPMKQTLIDSLPNDIISKDFDSDFLKYSSYSDNTVTNGMGITNVETTLIFSSKSFLPTSASANLTLYFHGRASNLLEVDFHIENAEPLLKSILGQLSPFAKEERTSSHQNDSVSKEARARGKINEDHLERDVCLSSTNSYLKQARALLSTRQKMEEVRLKCWVGVKVFGNELSMFTCDDLSAQMDQMSLSAAGLAVKLLKGHEVQLNHRAVLLTEELVLPSLSGLPVKIATNMTSFLSLRLKGNINYRDMSHFSLGGYIKPNAFVGLSARMGVDGVLGQAAVGWMSELVSSTSLDGSVHMQEGQDLRVTLNTPEDAMDIMSLSSRVFQLSGDHMEEIKGPKSRIQHTACTPKTYSKMVGWQLCANVSLPLASGGISLPPSGPTHLSIRLLKLDRGLHYYLLEAAYSMTPVIGSWFPKEASLHLLLATPKSSIPRDMSLDLTFNPRRFLLRVSHPLKSILVQGQLEQERSTTTAKLELIIDGVHYYVLALVDKQTLISELRTRYHFEANMADNRNPVILSANVTRELGRKMSFSATMKNVFRLPASLSVALERRRDSHSRQYSLEADLLFPDVIGSRILGIMEQKGALWSSALRLKYGLGDDARQLHQECHTSQSVKSERHANLTFTMRADHEFYCSNTAAINHKIHFRHEESPSHVRSSVDMSYGKHWDEINNKRTLLLSQSFKNQTTQNHTSYILEFNLQVPDKDLNYRTQLLHSYIRQLGSDSSTHLKINYNNLTPLVVGLHWKSPPNDTPHKKWEGTFNMDTPWLYIYTTHKLSQHHHHTLQLNSELTANKWVTIRNLILEASYRDKGREKEAHLKLRTPAVTFLQVGGLGFKGKKNMKASCSLSSLWTAPLRGEISLETLKSSLALQMSSSYGKKNITFAAALNTSDKPLKKRQARLSVSLLEPKSPPTEFEFEGTLEELMKDKKMYQKTALLHLRQPFKSFPQKLLLRETFTVDLLKGLYILESRAGFFGMKEIIHTLTIGSKLPSPFVCSALVHPFNTETFPSDCEICVITSSNQTQKGIRGWLRIGSQEKLSFFGELLSNSLDPNRPAIKVQANVTHQLELQIPSFALVEGDVCWSPQNNRGFDYVVRGRLKIERQECQLSMQLNGTSDKILLYSALRHPFKSKIPKSLEAKATANLSTPAGRGSSSICVKADGRDKLILDAQVSHLFLQEDKSVLLGLNFSQSLLPKLTDLHVKMAAHMSRQRHVLFLTCFPQLIRKH